MKILYLAETDVEHLKTCKLNSTILSPLFPHSEKKLIRKFLNIFSRMMMVTIQATSTLQATKQ